MILKGECIYDNIIVVIGEEYKVYLYVIVSKVVDIMLIMVGIEVIFVIIKNSLNIGILVCSRNNINV